MTQTVVTTKEQRTIEEVYENYSAVVKSALADPDGARRALYDYGLGINFPPGGMPPVPVNRGEESWLIALTNANPLWLGQAWERVVAKSNQKAAVRYTKMGQRAREEEEDMIIQPSAVGSVVEPGIYRATITEIVPTVSTYEGKQTPQLQFQFVFLDGDGAQTDQEFRGWTSQKWHEKSKLYAWSKVLLGRKCPTPTDPVDVDRLVGKKCDLEIVAYKKQNGDPGVKIDQLYPFASMTKDEDEEAS